MIVMLVPILTGNYQHGAPLKRGFCYLDISDDVGFLEYMFIIEVPFFIVLITNVVLINRIYKFKK